MTTNNYPILKRLGLIGGIILFAIVLAWPRPEDMTASGQKVLAVTALMASWWTTECLPIAATALVPLVLFPLLGVMPMQAASECFGDANILFFAGGFFIAMSMQKWNLHKRIALHLIRLMGTNPHFIVLGFMVSTGFLSMWISNTAACMMLLPIGISVITQFERYADKNQAKRFAVALMLGIAYGANIGGIGTLIGTPPNVVLRAQMASLFPEAPEIGFLQWMLIGVPLAVVFIPITWLLLTRALFPLRSKMLSAELTSVRHELVELGQMTRGEWTVLIVFTCTALAWISRSDLQLGTVIAPGWARLFPEPNYIHDGTVAILFALALFATPVDLKKGEFALDWETARGIPWGILLLFGGGLAVAKGFGETGLVEWAGLQFRVLSGLSPVAMILCAALLTAALTQLTSNTATTIIVLPILAGTAGQVLHVHPLLLMLPATLGASCAFILPISTPPNAIMFASGHITIPQMAKAGLVVTLIGIGLVTIITYYLAVPIFHIAL